MKQSILEVKILLMAIFFSLIAGNPAHAGDDIQLAGDVLVVVLPALAGGLTLGYKDREGALQFAESAALTLGTTFSLKYTVKEERPNGKDNHSFPSAHASVSFASAEFVRKRYGWEYGVPAYAAASFVAYSRVEANQHYSRDVLAGAAIGIGSSYLFTRSYAGWQVQADADTMYYGLRFCRAW
jgi:membrane-associated phospholipid phosphatase